MDKHALSLLEFPKVVEELVDLCMSPDGARLMSRQDVLTSAPEVAERLDARRVLSGNA